MFQIKICGVTSPDDAVLAAEAGADAIGLNFYPNSPRYVTPETARKIGQAVRSRLLRVGIVVNPTEQEALALKSLADLDALQLHGDEPAELAARLSRSMPIVKAFRIAGGGLAAVLDYLDEFRQRGGAVGPVLFDAYHPDRFGGVGIPADWETIRSYPTEQVYPPFILAGGLTPENVGAAILAVAPRGVDTASGVEQCPGRKDPERVHKFIAEARRAFAALAGSHS